MIDKQVFQNTNLKVGDFSVREEIWKPLVRKKQLGYLEYQKFYYDLGTPQDLKIAKWNRQLVQMGMSEMGRQSLADTKKKMGLEHRDDLISFADMIEVDEERI